MTRTLKARPPPDHFDTRDTVLAHWHAQSDPPPSDGLLRGRYWEDEAQPEDEHAGARGWMMPAAVIVGSLGAAIGVALSYLS